MSQAQLDRNAKYKSELERLTFQYMDKREILHFHSNFAHLKNKKRHEYLTYDVIAYKAVKKHGIRKGSWLLGYAFHWADTPQGYKYWEKIYERIHRKETKYNFKHAA